MSLEIYPPFTTDFRFTGPTVAISCDVDYDSVEGEYHARGSNGLFHGTSDTAEGAALNCFMAWMTRNRGWYEQTKEQSEG